MAICRGSVSPSRSTSTGAFILESEIYQSRELPTHRVAQQRWTPQSPSNAPDLQGPGAEDTRTLVLGQVWGGCALVSRDLFLSRLLHHFARVASIGIAGHHDVLPVDGRLIGSALDTIVALKTLVVDEVFGLIFVKDFLLRLVVVAVK